MVTVLMRLTMAHTEHGQRTVSADVWLDTELPTTASCLNDNATKTGVRIAESASNLALDERLRDLGLRVRACREAQKELFASS